MDCMRESQKRQGLYPIVKKTACARQTYDVTVLCPDIAKTASPGQFVHIRCPGVTLRRPISICQVDAQRGTVRLVFEVRGRGTAELAQLGEGELMDLLGPLGHGFEILPGARAIAVGGGIGVPPMLEALRSYGENGTAILGFRSANAVILEEDFLQNGNQVRLATDDGTRGTKGFVTQLLKEQLEQQRPDIIYACGPTPMLKGVAALAQQYGVRCQVSLEERMGCGVGACLVCACKTLRENGYEGYSHVCKDGPVFEAQQVVFE